MTFQHLPCHSTTIPSLKTTTDPRNSAQALPHTQPPSLSPSFPPRHATARHGTPRQVRDLETIQSELCLKDVELATACYELAYNEARKKQAIARAAQPKGMDALDAVHVKIMEALEVSAV